MSVEIGGADGGYKKKKTFKIKDGDNVYRLLPSLGFNGKKPNGKWSKFYRIHFGYKNSEGKLRPFQSTLVKNQKTKMIEKPDAALERLDKLKAALENAKKTNNKAVYDQLLPLVGTNKPLYNLDSNHYINVINEAGEIGVLKLRHKGKLALDAVIKQLRDKGIEPLGKDTGRFFVINRTGTALETTYSVSVKTKAITVEGIGEVEQPINHVLTDAIIARLEDEAADLDEIYGTLTSEEVAQIVAESDLRTGNSPAVDRIIDAKGAAAKTAEEEPEGEDEGPTTASNAAPAAPTTPPVSQAASAPAPTPAQAAAPTQSLSQPTPAPVQIQTPPPAASGPALTEMSDEDFLKSLGA